MDWTPLLVGSAVGVGEAALQKYGPTTGALGAHKFILYQAAVFGVGAWGDLGGHLSPDVSYGLMVGSLALLGEDFAYKGVQGAFGDLATHDENRAGTGAQSYVEQGAPFGGQELVASSELPHNWNRRYAQVPNTQPATAVG
jgi:hypothetical protein